MICLGILEENWKKLIYDKVVLMEKKSYEICFVKYVWVLKWSFFLFINVLLWYDDGKI